MQGRTGHPLSCLFEPRSVAVVGAREDRHSVGGAVAAHLSSGFDGKVYWVHRRHRQLHGQPVYPALAALPEAPDLVVIATPAHTLAELVTAAARRGARAVAVLSSVLALPKDAADAIAAAAKAAGVRVLGPNALGIVRPSIGLNASFALPAVRAGSVALLTQSGGLASALLDWAEADQIGFSSVISLGNQADVGFAEALDFLTVDAATDSIVMYLEGIRTAPRRFVSALRAAARIKPVIVLKAGRAAPGARAANTHTGALSGPDDAFDAAIRRCGAVRVQTFLQWFAAAKVLSSRYRTSGRRLAIVTNGGGPGVIAVDRATELGLEMAALAPDTLRTVDHAVAPQGWSRENPADVMEDAGPDRFQVAVDACLADAGVDGIVAIVTPQVMTNPVAVADALVAAAGRSAKPLIGCFMGEAAAAGALARLQTARLPAFRAPEPAVEAFAHLVEFQTNQKLLLQVPGRAPALRRAGDDPAAAQRIVADALAGGHRVLPAAEAKAVLRAYGITVTQATVARSADEAAAAAGEIDDYAVAVKVHSRDIVHKADAGGVQLGLSTEGQVRAAYREILRSVGAAMPQARVEGVTVEPMLAAPFGRELLVGVYRDPVFGPVIVFGAGGRETDLIADRAAALPPLDRLLARDLIGRTRVSAALDHWHGFPKARRDALEEVLLRVSELVCELPAIESLDINPLVLDDRAAWAVDAYMTLAPEVPPTKRGDRHAHLAIRPYPAHLEENWTLPGGVQVHVRPIRPDDAALEQAFVRDGLSDESRYFRFANAMHELSDRMLVRFTQIDYDRELALVAVVGEGDAARQVGVARYAIGPDDQSCEFALAVADAWQGQGLGRRLMDALLRAAESCNLTLVTGHVLAHNNRMLHLMTRMGFDQRADPEDSAMRYVALRLPRPGRTQDPDGRGRNSAP